MNGDIVPLPRPADTVSDLLDTSPPPPARSKREIILEGISLVPNLMKLLYRLLRDDRVPRRSRMLMGAVAAYLAFPIDIIPDYIPILGQMDDLLLLGFAIDYLLAGVPDEVVAEYWDGSEDALELVRGAAGWGVELLPRRIRRLVGRG